MILKQNKLIMPKINKGHYLELLDRLLVQTSMIETHLYKHPLSKKLKKVRKLIDNAGYSLAEAYQMVGDEFYKQEENEKAISQVIFRRHKDPSN